MKINQFWKWFQTFLLISVSHEMQIAAVKQITVAEENRKETHSSEEHREHSKGTRLAKMEYVRILLGK